MFNTVGLSYLVYISYQIHHNAKKCESGKAWSVFYGVLATGACAGAICTGNKGVYTTVCGVSIGTIYFSCNTYKTNDKTLEKSACLRQDAKDWRMEIANSHYNLDIVKVNLEMYPGDTDHIPEILVPISFSFLVMLCVIGTVIYRCI